MAKKGDTGGADRSNPKKNKSLAIRMTLKALPSAKATEIVDAVKREYGHAVNPNMVYMVKAKQNMRKGRRGRRPKSGDAAGTTSVAASSPMTSAALWVGAIKTARQLLQETGSVANATALLRALDG